MEQIGWHIYFTYSARFCDLKHWVQAAVASDFGRSCCAGPGRTLFLRTIGLDMAVGSQLLQTVAWLLSFYGQIKTLVSNQVKSWSTQAPLKTCNPPCALFSVVSLLPQTLMPKQCGI